MQLLYSLIVLCFLFTQKVTSSPQLFSGDHISIDCGSTAASTSLRGRQWLGDFHPKLAPAVEVEGSSTRSSADAESVDRVPYNTARISRSQFSYVFHLNPGQKFIRLHFNPASYNGFHHLDGFFTVEAGPFTLLANFSASIAADALSVKTVVKELCVIIRENEPLKLVFTPSISPSKHACAFINGIEIISVPWSVNYCHGGGIGVQVVGSKSMVYIDNSTSLELVHRQNIKWGSVSSRDDIDITGMFGMWATTLTMWIKGNRVNNMSWRISVDVGFRYLVRIHFCELGLGMVEAGRKDFMLVINQVIVSTSGDLLQERGNQSALFYKNYMVIVEGHKRDIFISLQSDHVFLDRNGPLEGFEVFKLNNHDYNLASPNPLPPKRDSPLQPIQILLSLVGRRNALATVVFAAICLVNIIVCMMQQTSVSSFTEEEDSMPSSTRAKRLCRRFTLAEIQAATDNFYDAFVIGKGGFGKVYKGLIDNGRDTVAIKRLKPDSKQGKREFWTEIETLSELRHVNLVSLIGYCNEQPEMTLVYEYMPCGTLADHLYKLARKNNAHHPLSWKQRLQICIGAGRGLDYLHTGLENEIVHHDVKASNILLDENFVAKVSDFGLAKIKSGSKSQNEASTNLKGTFGYIDPDFFRTHRLTIASDTYSFGVVLLEVLCGRPAVEPWAEEDKRSLTMWARDNISKGQVDHIIDPSLREEISADSLKTFVRIAEKCLIDEPKKRPAIAHVVMKLQFALERHYQTESLVAKERVRIADIFPSADRSQNENTNSLVPNERTNVADVLPQEIVGPSIPHEITNVADVAAHADKFQHEKSKSLFPDKDILSGDDRTIPSMSTRPTPASSNVENAKKEQINSNMISSGKVDERKSVMRKLSRKLWPWDALWKTGKASMKKDVVSHALSAPIQRRTSYMGLRGSPASRNRTFSAASGSDRANPSPMGQILPLPNLRSFSFSELKAATRNFKSDTVVGEGGFGKVYKGWIDKKSSGKAGSGTVVAIKMLNPESKQGFEEWQSELNFLGRLSHPNLVTLLGYGWGPDKVLFLVYEFMQKGSLENQIFQRNSSVETLPWDMRVKIMIGAARGMAFLHSLDKQVIYRDFKTSNILLDGSYHAKLSDFGLAKMGPLGDNSHVSTRIVGTYGYAAPEYIVTGHLYVKSDVYGFGVVLVEMLTGLRVLDRNRPQGRQNLIEWTKPHLSARKKLNNIIDSRLEGKYPAKSAIEYAQLAQNCLEFEPKKRPSMQEVVEILENMDAVVEKPRQPRVRFS